MADVEVIKERRAGFGGCIDDVNEALAERERDEHGQLKPSTLRALMSPSFEQACPIGRPTVYTDDMPARAFRMLARCDLIFTKKLVAAHFGVSVQTLHEWRAKYPSLAEAIAQGLAAQEAMLATQMAGGLKYSQSLYAVLKNLHDWRDKIDETHKVDYREAMQRASQGAKVVNWDDAAKKYELPAGDTSATASDAPMLRHANDTPPEQSSCTVTPVRATE